MGAVCGRSVPMPVVDWNDPNLKFVDVTGDGIADVIITEDVALPAGILRIFVTALVRNGELPRLTMKHRVRALSSTMGRNPFIWRICLATACPTLCAYAMEKFVIGQILDTGVSVPRSPWTNRHGSICRINLTKGGFALRIPTAQVPPTLFISARRAFRFI